MANRRPVVINASLDTAELSGSDLLDLPAGINLAVGKPLTTPNWIAKSIDFTAALQDEVVYEVDTSSSARIATLPAITGNQGITIWFKRRGTNRLTVTTTDPVDGTVQDIVFTVNNTMLGFYGNGTGWILK